MPWLAVCSFPGWPTGPQHVPAHPSLPVDNSHWPFSLLQPGGDFLSYISFSPLLITTYAQFSENYIIVAPTFFPPCLGPYSSAWNSFASCLERARLRSHLLPRASLALFTGGHQHQWFPALPHHLASFKPMTGAGASPAGTESGV